MRKRSPSASYEQFELDGTYAFGIGLNFVATVDVASRATIDRFMVTGETERKSPVPVPRGRLPTIAIEETRQNGEYASGMYGAAIRMP